MTNLQADDGLPPIRALIAQYGLSADKNLGQNFILDLNLTRRIARLAPHIENTDIVEIGAGPGGLTRGLLMEGAKSVTIIEADKRFEPVYEDIAAAYPNRLRVHFTDALAIELDDIMAGDYQIIANLPYNIATPLLMKWLESEWPPRWQGLTLMFQKEVAARIVAQAGARAYGRLSVLANWRCHTRIALRLPPQAFVPPPKVESAIVHFTPRNVPIAEAKLEMLQKITRAAFGQRRKMLRSSLKQLCLETESVLQRAGILETSRAEDLTIEEFCALARIYEQADRGR